MIALVELPEFMEQEKFNQIVNHFPVFTTNPNTKIGVKKEFGVISYKVLSDGEYLSSEVNLQGGEYYKGEVGIEHYNVYLDPPCPMVALCKNFGMVDIEKFARVAVGVSFKIVEVYGG